MLAVDAAWTAGPYLADEFVILVTNVAFHVVNAVDSRFNDVDIGQCRVRFLYLVHEI